MFWKLFEKKKPKKEGWYLCTIEVPGMQRYVMDLHWYPGQKAFIDNRRLNTFYMYDVYGYNPDTGLRDKKIQQDMLCDRTDEVVAWRKLPKTYMRGFKEDRDGYILEAI